MILTTKDGLAPGALPSMEAAFEVKDASEWEFEGYSNTWEKDLVGDRILPGAFRASIAEFKAGRKIPLLDQHRRGSFRDVYGSLIHAEETNKGLWTRFAVVKSNDGAELMARVRDNAVDALSIGFGSARYDDADDGGRLIHSLDLMEISAVIWPANESSRIGVQKVRAGGAADAWAPDDPRRVALAARIRRLQAHAHDKRRQRIEDVLERLRPNLTN